MKYVMELLFIELKSQYGYRAEFMATDLKKSMFDRCRPLTSTRSTTHGDPAPFVFRQETGMQKGGKHTKRKGRKEMGYSECVCVRVCVQECKIKAV